MSDIKTDEEISILMEGGKRLSRVLEVVSEAVVPGITTDVLDEIAEKLIRDGGDEPAFKNYQPTGAAIAFPATLCVSINNQVVHGIPGSRVINQGDLVGLDLGIIHGGLFTDMAVTVGVVAVSQEDADLMRVTRQSLSKGLNAIKAGARVGDIGAAIETFVTSQGKYGIVRDLGGHGVGHEVHEAPFIPNFGKKGTGEKLMAGQVLAIEPMITRGTDDVEVAQDKFTFQTKDGSQSAHFELTVVVTEKGFSYITPPIDLNV